MNARKWPLVVFAGSLLALSLLAFHSRATAVLTASDEPKPIVPVSHSSLIVERGGYRIEAESPGRSLLVLPVEYSHCLRADLTTTGTNPPRLLRANLTMAAILFGGRLEGSLKCRLGPLSSRCLIEDWRDANEVRLGEAREWPTMR
jgi:hypothetical protein